MSTENTTTNIDNDSDNTPLPNETPEARFIRLANSRMNKAVKAIKLLRNLSAPSYKYTPEQIAKLKRILYENVDATMKVFDKTTSTIIDEETFL